MSRPTFRITAALASVLLGWAGGAHADIQDDLRDCRSVQADDARLACYDALAARQASPAAAAEPAKPSAPPRAAAPAADAASPPAPSQRAPVALSQEELFGRDTAEVERIVGQATGQGEPMGEMAARIVEIARIGRDRVRFTLDNGQVWEQTQTSTLTLEAGDEIEISRGLFGSYLARRAGNSRSMRVTRVD